MSDTFLHMPDPGAVGPFMVNQLTLALTLALTLTLTLALALALASP